MRTRLFDARNGVVRRGLAFCSALLSSVLLGGVVLSAMGCSDECGSECDECSGTGVGRCSLPDSSQTSSGSFETNTMDGEATQSGGPASNTTTAVNSSSQVTVSSDDADSTDVTDESNGSGDATITDADDSSDAAAEQTSGSDATSSDADTSSDGSDTTETSAATSGETSGEPVAPDGGASDSSTRLKTVPVGSSDATLGYWQYLPPNYDAAPAPLLVFTHGASWQGDGSEEQLQELLTVGPVNLISEDQWPNARPFIVLAPQNSHSGCFTAEDIDGFYRYALNTYNIDTTRIYHTGQSCGAIGGWNYLAAHLDEFVTAAVLISGDGQDAFAQAGCDLGKVAIWGLHNEKDGTVNSSGTINPITDLMACDPVPDVKLTIYPDATEHDAWTKTYDLSAGNDIYSWLLEHVHP